MERCFLRWTQSFSGKIQRVIAIDGKTLRGSRETRSDLEAIHRVSAFAAQNELILGQLKTKGLEVLKEPIILTDLLQKISANAL